MVTKNASLCLYTGISIDRLNDEHLNRPVSDITRILASKLLLSSMFLSGCWMALVRSLVISTTYLDIEFTP